MNGNVPWAPEHVVDAETARALVRTQFPAIPCDRIEALGAGWDNTVFLVDGAWVFRFPRRELAVALLVTESEVLPAIADALPLAIPRPQLRGEPSEAYPWPFLGYRMVQGTTACRASLDDDERARMAPVLGGFLRTLHDLPPPPRTPLDTFGRCDMRARSVTTRERIASLVADGWLDRAERCFALLEIDTREPSDDLRLVHGDLYARHLVVDDARALHAVIDWGDVHQGDVALDLAVAIAFLPLAARPAFRRAYGEVDAATWTLARSRALFSSLAILHFGHETGDVALAREARVALANVLAEE